MNVGTEAFIPILFALLACFVAVNIAINLVLLYISRRRINRLLCLFWVLALLVLLLQSRFQTGDLAVTLAYSATLLTATLMGMIGFETMHRPFPLRPYLALYVLLYPLTLLLAWADFRFEIVAAPFSLATAAPLTHLAWLVLYRDRQHATKLQKVFGILGLVMAAHCINFALFRMQPGAQLWGWPVSYAIFDVLAVILPSIALENAYLTEQERLETQLRQRTAELDGSLEENRGLLKILLHDIYNPLGAMNLFIGAMDARGREAEPLAAGLRKAHEDLERIVGGVKELYQKKNARERLAPLSLQDCCGQLHEMFDRTLEGKRLALRCECDLAPSTRVLADPSLFVHSVLGNLLGNAIKFSPLGGEIDISARENGGQVVIEVRDRGPGMPAALVGRLAAGGAVDSVPGSTGEQGMGLGLTIVKSVLENCGGALEIVSRPASEFPLDHGTLVRVRLQRAAIPSEAPEPVPAPV